VEVTAHLDQLAVDGARLADAAEAAGCDAPVAACEWNVGELLRHVGGVHRWATEIVETAAASPDVPAAAEVGGGPAEDDALLEWYRAGHAALVQSLRAAPDDLECFTFLPAPSPLAFWARRQAHETAIHRADAESAGGPITAFPPGFAQDGIAEMLQGFAARKSQAISIPGTLLLRPHDQGPAWRVQLGGEHTEAVPVDAGMNEPGPSTAVAGSASDLYLWLWNRPAAVAISGDRTVAERWGDVRVRWSN
jgi:uncharacterized protein (TIGR03083 family)